VTVPQLDVGASAGAGALTGEEGTGSHLAFDPKWLRRIAGEPTMYHPDYRADWELGDEPSRYYNW